MSENTKPIDPTYGHPYRWGVSKALPHAGTPVIIGTLVCALTGGSLMTVLVVALVILAVNVLGGVIAGQVVHRRAVKQGA